MTVLAKRGLTLCSELREAKRVTSPNPEDDKSETQAATLEQEASANKQESAREPQRLEPEHSHYPDEKFPRFKLFLQIVMTAATVGAFFAAGVYAHYASQQVDKMRESVEKSQAFVDEQKKANKANFDA